jgi:pteridine reductase
MTRALALELAPDVRVNAIAPGAILWPDSGKDDAAKQRCWTHAAGRTGTPEEVAEAVRWLLRDATLHDRPGAAAGRRADAEV